ncbi:MAG: phosphatidate cytidylyltransferase [Bacteroidota bacterium]
MSNALLRILTALVGAPLVVGLLYLGGPPFVLLVVAMTLAMQYEMVALLQGAGLSAHRWPTLTLGALVVVVPIVPEVEPVLALGLVVLALYSLFDARPVAHLLGGTLLSLAYPALCMAALVAVRLAPSPVLDDLELFLLTLSLFLFVWATDTCAYYVGKSIGRRPLAPSISPKKTLEGSLGGLVGALIVGVGVKVWALPTLDWGHLLALAALCSIGGQLGDLLESRFKRQAGVKDSGRLLPGHGGVLDRFDGLLIAAPLAYLYLRYVAQVL